MKNKIWKIIGIIAGALTIIAGILIMARYSGLEPYLDIAPADFYTYLYQAAAYAAYNTLIITQVLCFGLGILLISLGIFEICFFGMKLMSADGPSEKKNRKEKAAGKPVEDTADAEAEAAEPEAPESEETVEEEEAVSPEVLEAERKYDEFIAKFMDKPKPEDSKIPDLRKLVMDEPEIEEAEDEVSEINDISDLKKLAFDTSDILKQEEPAESAPEIAEAEEAAEAAPEIAEAEEAAENASEIAEAEEAVQSADEILAEAEAVEKEIQAALADAENTMLQAEDIETELRASELPEAHAEEPVADGDNVKQGPFTYDKFYKGSVDFYEY